MTAHEGPIRCRDHGHIEDFGCPVRECDDDHPLADERCGDWCEAWDLM